MAPVPSSTDHGYWLMKSEPAEVSIDDLAAARKTLPWTGVRNYQARNFMRDAMQAGRWRAVLPLVAPSPASPAWPKSSAACTRRTQFDPASPYFDAKSSARATALAAGRRQAAAQDPDSSLAEMRRAPDLAACACCSGATACRSRRSATEEWRAVLAHLGD